MSVHKDGKRGYAVVISTKTASWSEVIDVKLLNDEGLNGIWIRIDRTDAQPAWALVSYTDLIKALRIIVGVEDEN